MSEAVVHVSRLGKHYRVGERERYFALRDMLARDDGGEPVREHGARWGTYRAGFYRRAGRGLRELGTRLLNRQGINGVWIDVGAHQGEATFIQAQNNPSLTVFAFEPNWGLARQLMGRLPNFIVLPMAVSENDGVADFFLNAADVASSLLPFSTEGLRTWKGGEALRVESRVSVPTIRLDTFMQCIGARAVDYLKVDAQGADFSVIQSAGLRIRDIQKITLEVDVTSVRLYQGSAGREQITAFLEKQGFVLSEVCRQSLDQEENLTFVRGGVR